MARSRPWRIWAAPQDSVRARYAVSGYSYATPEAAQKALDQWSDLDAGYKGFTGTIYYVADINGNRPPEAGK